jgi:predicted metalloprotease with PDZ domain
MKKFLILIALVSMQSIAWTQNFSERQINIVKIDTTSDGQIDTIFYNFDLKSNSEELNRILKEMNIDIQLLGLDSMPQQDMLFGNDPFKNFNFEGGFTPTSNSRNAQIGITVSQRYTGEGVMVETVMDISLAAALGLNTGDIIYKLDDTPIKNFNDLKAQLSTYQVGSPVTIHFKREGKKKQVAGYFIPAQNTQVFFRKSAPNPFAPEFKN